MVESVKHLAREFHGLHADIAFEVVLERQCVEVVAPDEGEPPVDDDRLGMEDARC
jgi:hypothetical protein